MLVIVLKTPILLCSIFFNEYKIYINVIVICMLLRHPGGKIDPQMKLTLKIVACQ